MSLAVAERSHGTRAKYVAEGCRCPDCTRANTEYAKYQQKRRRIELAGGNYASGRWASPFVDAAPVRARIRQFSDLGVGYKRLAQLAGVGKTALFSIRAGQRDRCRRELADAVLAVPLEADVAAGALVDATETRRLLRTILRQTRWSRARLAREIGAEGARALQVGRGATVTRSTSDAVAALGYRLMVDL